MRADLEPQEQTGRAMSDERTTGDDQLRTSSRVIHPGGLRRKIENGNPLGMYFPACQGRKAPTRRCEDISADCDSGASRRLPELHDPARESQLRRENPGTLKSRLKLHA